MRTKLLILILFSSIPVTLVSQETDTLDHTWSLRFNPLSPIDPYGPSSLQLGLEYAVSPRISVAVEGLYFYTYRSEMGPAPDQLFSGYGFRVQATKWSRVARNADHDGLAFDITYKYTTGTCRDSIKPDSIAPYSQDYQLSRKVIIVRGYGVWRADWGRRLWGELHYGLGVRFKSAKASGISEASLADIDNRDDHGDSSDIPKFQHQVGDYWYPDIVLGFRIGYLLR